MVTPIRVGIIGASPSQGWASMAHLPAIHKLPEIELVAVATTRQETADAARELYGARRAYADPAALVADPDVEAVTVAVKVPAHEELVRLALDAGKHVYCEWPLTPTTASASTLADLAARRSLQTIVGLQAARSAPVRHVAGLIADGLIGKVLAARVVVTGPLGGPQIPRAHSYMLDAANGANILTIWTGHALDTLCAVAGEIVEVSATLGSLFPEVTIVETGESVVTTSPNQVSVSGRLQSGAVFSAAVNGAMPWSAGFELIVYGDEGGLSISSRPSLTAAQLVIEHTDGDGRRHELSAPAGDLELQGPPQFVANLYRDLTAAIRNGERHGPDFAHAVNRQRLLDAIRAAADENRAVMTAGVSGPA